MPTTAMVVGIIIGASIFVQPSEITRDIPSVSGVVIAWGLAGLLTLAGALVCAELSSAFPRSGGVYVFLSRAWSPALGFLWGWAMFWSMHSGIIAAIALIFGRYAAVLVPGGGLDPRVAAVAAIAALSAVNILGVRYGGRVQTVLTAAKLVAIAALLIGGVVLQRAAVPQASVPLASVGPGTWAVAVAAGLFAFGGWHMVTYAAGETLDAARTIPRALVAGTLIVTACYAGLNAVYLRVLPIEAVRESTHVAADAAEALVGGGGARLVAVLVLVSTFGALNGIILAGPRVYYSMASDGLIVGGLGAVHPRYRTPARAIALQGAWSCVLAFASSYRTLFMSVVNIEWVFFALLALGLFRLRRRSDYQPRARVWGHPVTTVIFAAASLVIVVMQAAANLTATAFGAGLVLAGIPAYALWRRKPTHASD